MPTCHILSNLDEQAEPRSARLARMAVVLKNLGFESAIHGRELCDEFRSMNLETQGGVSNGLVTDYSDHVMERLCEAPKGDIIIATESWHGLIFKGLLDANGGKLERAPVIELWIDYPDSFARYRVFSSRFALAATAGAQNKLNWNMDWVYARPFFQAAVTHESALGTKEFKDDPFSTSHLEAGCKGVPVVAPDYGIWAETIAYDTTGMLYRSPEGREMAMNRANALPGQGIVDWINVNFSFEAAGLAIAKFMERAANA